MLAEGRMSLQEFAALRKEVLRLEAELSPVAGSPSSEPRIRDDGTTGRGRG
jgi:hypothetical protein